MNNNEFVKLHNDLINAAIEKAVCSGIGTPIFLDLLESLKLKEKDLSPSLFITRKTISVSGKKRDLLAGVSALVFTLMKDTDIDEYDIAAAVLAGLEHYGHVSGRDDDPDWVL